MQKVVEFLQANPVQYLATVGRDGKAKCRPFMFCFEQDGKLWFCTNNTKDVYKDMQENPNIEISVSSPSFSFTGMAIIRRRIPARRRITRFSFFKTSDHRFMVLPSFLPLPAAASTDFLSALPVSPTVLPNLLPADKRIQMPPESALPDSISERAEIIKAASTAVPYNTECTFYNCYPEGNA